MTDLALDAKGLVAGYPRRGDVLGGVDFAVRRGELLALVGLNGSGKSTLLKVCAGLLVPRQGSVQVAGTALAQLRPHQRARRVALLPQHVDALPNASAEDFVLGGRYAHLGFLRNVTAHDRSVVAAALQRADVAHCRRRPLATLSGGERQRVLLARALAQEADVLLCDEPTSALDLPHQLDVLDVLAELARARAAVVWTTHDLNLASQYADRIVVLHRGTVHASGSPADVLRVDLLAPVWGQRLRVEVDNQGRPHVTPLRGARPTP